LWLTGFCPTGVIIVIHRSGLVVGSDYLEDITFNVDELLRLDTMEQARRLEQAARQIDEVQRAAAGDHDSRNWIEQQRQYLVNMQHLIFEC
jgi:DNA-binding SARP family transcriptional activator